MNSDYINSLSMHPFWRFSINLYRHKAAEQACQQLNNRHGLNINIILFCCWAAVEGYGRLDRSDYQRAFAATNRWHEMVTLELRKLRKLVKQYGSADLSLYNDAFEDEFAAEQTEQLMLADTLMRPPLQKRNTPQRLTDAFANLVTYLKLLQVHPDDTDYAAIYSLLGFIFADIERGRMIKLCVPYIKPCADTQHTIPLDGFTSP